LNNTLTIAGKKFDSRFFLGTGKFGSLKIMAESIKRSGTELVTVALRRVDPKAGRQNILSFIPKNITVMTNTSGARNADEAVRIAKFAKEAGRGKWIKIEVIPDAKYLMPDNEETVRATERLVKEGFTVLPYFNPDLICARRLRDAGAASIMPLGSPIGTGKGIKTKELIKILIEEIDLPVIVDAGIGLPSHAAEAMELGAAAVLVNTAVAISNNPPLLAEAFSLAVNAGYLSFLAGGNDYFSESASPSSPPIGFIRT
jgi:thiazole synthase